MANTFLTPDIIGREALMRLQNNTVTASLVHRGHQPEFTGAKVGDTISVRKPATFTAQEFSGSTTVQDASEESVSLVLEKHFDVTFAITAKDKTLELADFSEQLVAPAMEAIAQGVDAYALSKYVEFPYFFGTAGTPISTLPHLAGVGKVLDDNKVPMARRHAIIDTGTKASLMGQEVFVTADKRGDGGATLREAEMGRTGGINWYMDQNVANHTAGTFQAGSPLVNGAVSAGATTMAIDGGAGAETLKNGDLFTVAGAPGQYRFTADATASSGAIAAASFYPAAPTGGFADNAAITIIGDHSASLVLHPHALTLAVVPLELPHGAAQSAYVEYGGLGIRVVMDYDTSTKKDTVSLDLLVGAKVQQPELGMRLLG